MTIRICSGFSPTGRAQYGERFLRSFDRYWPAAVELQVWVEEPCAMPRDACRSLWDIPGASEFRDRYAGDLEVQGRAPRAGWKDKERQAGYSFRFDAYKFWKQILIPGAAAQGLEDGDILVWLDADVETTAPVPIEFLDRTLGRADVAYLGREPKYSEIGFWAVRISDRTLMFLGRMAEIYRSDEFLELAQWHSAFVWDHARRECALVERNLTPGGKGHVWPRSALAPYMRHDKGKRKPGGKA